MSASPRRVDEARSEEREPPGRPVEHPERQEWLMYAFDPRERAVAGARRREWTAIAETELDVVREMARCLRVIAEGSVPK